MILERMLQKLAQMQKRFGIALLGIFIAFTIFTATYIEDIRLESDFSKLMPNHIPITVRTNMITDTFGGQDTMFILLMIDDELGKKGTPNDIRDPTIMEYIVRLENSLKHESSIHSVVSVAPLIEQAKTIYPQLTQEAISQTLASIPQSRGLVSDDYKKTIMILSADVGGSEDKIKSLTELIEDEINALSTPPGVEIIITGTPHILATIIDLLKHDAIFTLMLASAIILLLLIIMQRSLTQALVIFTPIMLGIIWTMGTMGWLDIELTVVTAGLGAMILGLGVEYSVFMLTRYQEERAKGKSQIDAITSSVPAVGSAILGSGTTTIVGFMALSFSIMPMLQKLGQSLALGIFYSIVAAVAVLPIIILLEEDFEHWFTKKQKKRYIKKHTDHKRLAR